MMPAVGGGRGSPKSRLKEQNQLGPNSIEKNPTEKPTEKPTENPTEIP